MPIINRIIVKLYIFLIQIFDKEYSDMRAGESAVW